MGCGASTSAPPSSEEYPAYAKITKGHEAAIKGLFDKLDADSDGHLVAGELKDVVSKYTGETFDADKFFMFFDTHGAEKDAQGESGPDKKLDQKEFGWFLANQCESHAEPMKAMPTVIQKLEQIIAAPA